MNEIYFLELVKLKKNNKTQDLESKMISLIYEIDQSIKNHPRIRPAKSPLKFAFSQMDTSIQEVDSAFFIKDGYLYAISMLTFLSFVI